MKKSKWLTLFLIFSLLFAALYCAFNILIDPFGVFGDAVLDYYEYNITENPRVAKLAYLEDSHERYDSYIIGCSKTSSYPIETLNEYTGASFYNLFAYGGDMADEEKLAAYVIENYEPENIIIAMGPEAAYKYDFEEDSLKDNLYWKAADASPITFYGKYAFLHPSYAVDKLTSYFSRGVLPDASCVFNAETGAYNKIARDSVSIQGLEKYLENTDAKFNITHSRPLNYIEECVQSVKNIKEMCDERGISFKLIGSPLFKAEQDCYSSEDMAQLWLALSEVTDFYDFWGYSSLTSDARFFYDGYHFRNCMGDMALAYIYGDEDVYVPDDFGFVTTSENVSERISTAYNAESDKAESTNVPILMYHNITETPEEGANISVDVFEEQIRALYDAGYTAVLYEDVISYVEEGAELPEKPVVITFDDGYESNISLASPILEKYGMCAEISIVGVTEGAVEYKDTGEKIVPHFSLDDDSVKSLISRGIISIQTHTYDLHQVEKYDGEGCRHGVSQLEGETDWEYADILTEDYRRASDRIKDSLGKDSLVYTYPYGVYNELSEAQLKELGVKVTVTTEYGTNEIIKGQPQSLLLLKRFNISESTTGESLIQMLSETENN